jgi:S-adenosylhomocysteine hydrolase
MESKQLPSCIDISNPFEKGIAEQLNHDLVAYLFAKPSFAVYSKLIGIDNYKIIGGWGSGKTMLLKYIAYETQLELKENKRSKAPFIGIYIKPAQSGFKPFLTPSGDFKEGCESLFAHYFNLLILEKFLCNIRGGVANGAIKLSTEEEKNFVESVIPKFKPIKEEKASILIFQDSKIELLESKVKSWRIEIETFLNISDLDKEASYKDLLSVYPTPIKSFLNEIFEDAQRHIQHFNQKRFYILLDECDSVGIGQQKVINTIIRARFPTMVFKLATRPPDIKTMTTIDEGVGLTDREMKTVDLDELYDPTSKSFRNLCYNVAKKRLERFRHTNTDIRQILGNYTLEDEIGEEVLRSYLLKEYPNKERLQNDFEGVYNDFKMAAAFQILSLKRTRKKYAGFETFVMLSSGIMLHFLELCRNVYDQSREKYLSVNRKGVSFKKIPLPADLQNKAAEQVSQDFYRAIEGRAQSIKDSHITMEFGGEIQYVVTLLGGIFRDKLKTFNEPEAARLEIPEGREALDNTKENPIRQIFDTAVAISVFQKGKPYLPKRYGGIRPPTYILNRILTPYLRISVRPRWRTLVEAKTFNTILDKNESRDFRAIVMGTKKKNIVAAIGKEAKALPPQFQQKVLSQQYTLTTCEMFEKMPVLFYLSKKINVKHFEGKSFLILLHFLRDLLPFVEACKKLGMAPERTLFFYKKYLYPYKDEIKGTLEKSGFRVFPIEEFDNVIRKETRGFKDIIVVEDGGLIVPKLHRSFPEICDSTIGAVEQTTKGWRNDSQIAKLCFPIISIAGSELKNTFEPPHVARAVINNLQRLMPETNFTGRKVLVIGCGNIGKEIALQLRDNLKMQETVYDTDTQKLVTIPQSTGLNIEMDLTNIGTKEFIIGATGETTISRNEILALKHNVYLASASSEQWEFGVDELNHLSSKRESLKINSMEVGTRYTIIDTTNCVNLLADGYPINFWKTESMPNEVSDLIMSLIFIAAVEVVKNKSLHCLPMSLDSTITNRLAREYDISGIYLGFHK